MKLDDIIYIEDIDRSPRHVKAVRQMLKSICKEIEYMTAEEAKALISAEIYDLDCQYDFKWRISETSDEEGTIINIDVSHSPILESTLFEIKIIPNKTPI